MTIRHMLPPLPIAAGDTADLGCALDHTAPHTLVIDRDESSTDDDAIVNLAIVFDGLPEASITVSREELLRALGWTRPTSLRVAPELS